MVVVNAILEIASSHLTSLPGQSHVNLQLQLSPYKPQIPIKDQLPIPFPLTCGNPPFLLTLLSLNLTMTVPYISEIIQHLSFVIASFT